MPATTLRTSATRQVLTLAGALLVCTACTAAPDPPVSAAPVAPAAPDDPYPPDGSDGPTEPAVDPDVPDDPGTTTSSDPGGSTTADDASTGAAEPPVDCEFSPELAVDCAAIARIVQTGLGVSEAHVARRHLRLEDASGAALGAEFHACLLVTDSACQPVPVTLEPAPARAITALLVRPLADPAANAALAGALAEFIDGRPEGEPIGVFRWGAAVTQISTPTADRARLHHLVKLGLQPLDGDSAPIADAIAAVADPLVTIERHSHLSLRQLLVVAPGHAELDPAALQLGGDMAHLRVDLLAADDVDAALHDAGARLDAALAAGELLIRQCGFDGLLGVQIRTAGGGPSLALPDPHFPGIDQADGPLACDPDQGLEPALPKVIAIDFSPEEQSDYASRVAFLSKEPFYGVVRTELNAPGVHARVKLKLHGQGSLDCQRKSMSLNLTDDLARQWLPDSGTDRFLLVSMCKDDRYITQFTANLLMAARGLFTPRFGMVELRIAGQSQGAYLLVEQPQSVLEGDATRARAIVRRASDIEGDAPDVEYAVGDVAQALAAYEALIAEAEVLHGDELLAWLDQAMDLDQYLRWIALMTALHSGDFIDEVYFTSTEATGPDASARDFFSISAWDQDDLFSNCHAGGVNAILDPHGLLYCAESRLDHAIFAEPAVYQRFAAALEQTLAWLDQATFDAATHASEDALLAILVRDEARAAMVELLDDNPAAVAYDVAEKEVQKRGKKLRERFAERRAELAVLLEAYGG